MSHTPSSVTAQLITIRALDLAVAEVAEVDWKLSVDCCHGNDFMLLTHQSLFVVTDQIAIGKIAWMKKNGRSITIKC